MSNDQRIIKKLRIKTTKIIIIEKVAIESAFLKNQVISKDTNR